jgi:hypothetical protein
VLLLSWHRAARQEVAARAAALAERRRQLREEQRRAKLADRFHRWAPCCCSCCCWHTWCVQVAIIVLRAVGRRSKLGTFAAGVRYLEVHGTCEGTCWGLLDSALCNSKQYQHARA